jgi:ferritin-like metal-binding protein YciE
MENARKPLENFITASENEVKSIRPKFDGASGLRDLLLMEMQSMYYIEKAVAKSFPKIIKNACSFELIEAITLHQEDTKKQIIRIEDSFAALNEEPLLQRCEAIECLLQEIDAMVDLTKFGLVRDAGLVLALHKIEHYEIASYSVLATYAENLKEVLIADWLAESLNEEKVAEMRLAKIANSIQFYTGETLV